MSLFNKIFYFSPHEAILFRLHIDESLIIKEAV